MIDLYKNLIIDHGLHPRNNYIMKNFTHNGRAFNHFCGDSFFLYLNILKSNIQDISFYGKGCSISIASASLMSLNFKKKSIYDALFLFNYFKSIIKNKNNLKDDYYDINVLSNVKKFPSRVKCATLIWHTLNDILVNNK